MDDKTELQKMYHELAYVTLRTPAKHNEYTDDDLFNATIIFQHVLLDVIFTANKGTKSQAELEALASKSGKALREFILQTTGKDMHVIARK